MTIVMLDDVKQVKFVVFLCLIRTTETRPDLWQSYIAWLYQI